MSRHSSSPPRTRRALPRWLKVSIITLLVVANLALLGVWWTVRSAQQSFTDNATALEEVVPELASRPEADTEPLYFLVIGSDSREGVDTDLFGNFGGARGDVVMLVRLDRSGDRAQILSIPRDTLVPIDGHGEDKINAAYAYGGAPLMVRTVADAFAVPIHHYVEVGFAGFQDLVDELGGVEMSFPYPARDAKSRLDVPEGTVTLDGFQALAYARSRSYQELRDGSWRSVDASDIGRAQRQQTLVLAILQQMRRPSTLTEAGSIVASFARHMTVDAALAESSLAELALAMRGMGASDIETATIPTEGATRNGGIGSAPRPTRRSLHAGCLPVRKAHGHRRERRYLVRRRFERERDRWERSGVGFPPAAGGLHGQPNRGRRPAPGGDGGARRGESGRGRHRAPRRPRFRKGRDRERPRRCRCRGHPRLRRLAGVVKGERSR
jgi:LCP family protein required for cell wall assembly